ncbi:MAG: hypothetical protein J7M25_03030 [Deltaproteobacteria bacterium]|nr:hypothetical protein [Deltaproteobacteria bacterium]
MKPLTALLLLAVLLSAGCRRPTCPNGCPSGQACSAQGVCVSGLDCSRIATRLRVCSQQILVQALPGHTFSDKKQRRLGIRISRQVAQQCQIAVKAKNRTTGRQRSTAGAKGRRDEAKEWNRCLATNSCQQFAQCVLTLAKTEPQTPSVRAAP